MNNQYKLSTYLVISDLIDADNSSDPSRLMFATRTGRSIKVKDHVYADLVAGEFSKIKDATLSTLLNAEVIVRAEEDEFSEILQQNQRRLVDGRRLDVTIQPTANCQLGCNYCGQVHSKKNVDPEISKKVTDRVCSNLIKNNYKELSVQWYGGEPLMAFTEILRMSDRLIEFCNDKGIAYGATMITNGLSFKPAVFAQLAQRRVRSFQITVDGLGETHDIMRITKEGAKTFDIILKNILEVTSTPEYKEHACSITVRVNVNNRSATTLKGLIDLLASHGLHERRVRLSFAPIINWGGNDAQKDSLLASDFGDSEIDWMLYALKKGFPFDKILPGKKAAPCVVVRPDAEVYDALGNIYPCYEFPYTPKYETAEHRIGHVDTIDTVRNDNAITTRWFADVKTDIAPCKSCNLFPVCGGGCPKQWYDGEVACPPYKHNIKEKLVLDYLIRKTRSFKAAETENE
jgi:uncharacterized protein